MAKQPKFVHLHVHSEYSMLDGMSQLPKLVTKVSQLNQPAVALTDHGNMYGAWHFYNQAKKAGVKPIIGLEAYVAKNSRFDKQIKPGSDQAHLTLIATSAKGYRNLLKLTSIANFEGFSYKPRIDYQVLAEYHQDLILLTGCPQSHMNQALTADNWEEARRYLRLYMDIFGKENVYVELQHHPGHEFIEKLTQKQIKLAREFNLPLVATNDVHYLEPDDAEAQDALVAVQTRKLLSDKNRMSMMDMPDLYLKSTAEMIEAFSDYPEAIANTLEIANRVDIKVKNNKLIFPNYKIPKGMTDAQYLTQLVYKRAKERFGSISQEIRNRLEYELDIINQKGYATYFLITQDFVNWAKKRGISVGPGRGSAAASLVSYVLKITELDPLYHKLPFERFLNPQRPTPPDIDIDFADSRRDEVIDYVAKKYGDDKVAHVITFGKMEARVAVRDIGRVLGMPYEEPDKIAKLIPNQPGKRMRLMDAVKNIPELNTYYQQPKYRKLIDLAAKVEGNVRHSSVHAAAIIVADKPLPEYTAIQKDSRSGKTITQYDMYALDKNVSDDAIGLLKFDFLGLRNLSIIQTALSLIEKNYGKKININQIPLDDKKTFTLLSKGETMGIFQLESAGMRRVAKSLKPSQFSDITAMVALYRPGPMDLIPQFIEGKHNPDSVKYPHPSLKPILEETYGVMVYQEQILMIANTMAGYTMGEADILRRAIGKKKKKLLDENKKRFIEQSVKKGYKRQVAEKVWGFIEAFANYGFNKAHAASYAMIAYQTAYLKANYPVEYMAALMSAESASTSQNRDEKIAQAVEECRKMGIKVLPPDINLSEADFTIEKHSGSLEDKAIRFGLTAIKHVGSAAIENILNVREEVGKFQSFTHFLASVDSRKVNKTTVEVLIKAGAFDVFSNRASMLEAMEEVRKKVGNLKSDVPGQDSLFDAIETQATYITDNFPQVPEYPKAELLSFEKELLGLYLTDHPMAQALKVVGKHINKLVAELDPKIHNGHQFMFGGVIARLREVTTKKTGKPMAFGTLEDTSGKIDFVVFPKTYEVYKNKLQVDQVVILKAKVDEREGELQLVTDKVLLPVELESTNNVSAEKEIFIPRKTSPKTLKKLGELLKANKGETSVMIIIPNGGQPEKMLLPYGVKWSKELKKQINELLKW